MHRYNTFIKRAGIRFLNVLGFIIYGLTLGWLKRPATEAVVKRILILELWGIGDLVMMSMMLGSLKEKYPQAQITLLSKPVSQELFSSNNLVDKFVVFNFPWTKFTKKYQLWKWDWKGILNVIAHLKNENFDLILDARGDIRNHFLSYFIGGKRRVGYNWMGGAYFLTDCISLKNIDIHRIDAWKYLCAYLGVETNNPQPNIVLTPQEDLWAEDYLKAQGISLDDRIIGIHPGARNRARRWPLNNFVWVAKYLQETYKVKVFFIISPDGYGEDAFLPADVLKVKVTMRQMTALFKKMEFLICNDGGAMHLATAVGTPVVAVFGPTNPKWFSPFGDNNSVVIKDHVKCRPCFDYCRYREPFCITTITVTELLERIDNKLKNFFLSSA